MTDELASAVARRRGRLQNKNLTPEEDANLRWEIGMLNRQVMLRYQERKREEQYDY